MPELKYGISEMREEAANELRAAKKRADFSGFWQLDNQHALRHSAQRPPAPGPFTSNSTGICQQFDDRSCQPVNNGQPEYSLKITYV
jgi:hypothetical protein